MNQPESDRIAKYLARAGIASRRDAEKLIEAGRVKVNGKVLTTPAVKVTPNDKVELDNIVVTTDLMPRVWRYHKPPGLLTSHKDPQGRDTVFDNLPEGLPRVISVGRLDLTSEGLLLLTNDGALARALELPSTGWLRRYRARAYGQVTQDQLDRLKDGIDIDGVPSGPIEATLERQQRDNAWITVSIREGKNREVRRALDSLGLRVNRLIRTSYGPFQLGELGKGQAEEIKTRVLKEQTSHLIEFPELGPAPKTSVKPAAKHSAKPSSKSSKERRIGPSDKRGKPKPGASPTNRGAKKPVSPRRPSQAKADASPSKRGPKKPSAPRGKTRSSAARSKPK